MDKKLVNAVIRQLGGRESLEDIANHGIVGGFGGFIYTSDTIAFFKRNRAEIVALVKEYADEFGESDIDTVARFNCLSGRNWDKERYTKEGRELAAEIARALYGRMKKDDRQVANALAWFAAEEVAHAEANKV